MNVCECIQHLVEQLRTLSGDDGLFPEVGGIDFEACESGDIAVYLHLADDDLNGGLPLVSSFELEGVVREEFEIAIYAASAMNKALNVPRASVLKLAR